MFDSKKSVTAIGEILWDVYPDKKRLGGAPFNFIYHVFKLTGSGNFISSVGSDQFGKEIFSFLNTKGFPSQYISRDKNHPTGTVQVTLDENKIPHFIISPECCYDFLELNGAAENLIDDKTDLLYFGTLSQRSVTSRNTIQSLFNKKIKYFCDLNLRHDFFTKEMIEAALHTSNVLKVNEHELEKLKNLFGLKGDEKTAMEQLYNDFDIELMCVTSGENGALLYNGKEFDHHKTEVDNIVDTVGAGDAFAAMLCIGCLNNYPLEIINKLANDFAAEICKVSGAIPEDDSIYERFRKLIQSI